MARLGVLHADPVECSPRLVAGSQPSLQNPEICLAKAIAQVLAAQRFDSLVSPACSHFQPSAWTSNFMGRYFCPLL
jgi:hypothetical protein